MKILIDSLSDRVYSVRQCAIQIIKKLSKKLGPKWCEKHALPMFTGFINNPNYLYRENALFGLKSIAMYLSHETILKVSNQIIEMAKHEKVPSVLVLIIQTINEFTQNSDDKPLISGA